MARVYAALGAPRECEAQPARAEGRLGVPYGTFAAVVTVEPEHTTRG